MVSNKFDISGKHAIVTGGAQGLSKGMAEGLLEAGCKVVLIDMNAPKLEQVCADYRAVGYEAYAVAGNMGVRHGTDNNGLQGIDGAFEEAMKILDGRLDIMIPAAGIQRRYAPYEFPEEMWDAVINVNLQHVWFMCQKALQVMVNQPSGGKIINIGSMVSWFGGTNVAAYVAAKGAVTQLTKSIASDCAKLNINANCLCPGYMDTEMNVSLTPERKAEVSARIPAIRWGTPDDMKGPVIFLASSASDYLNGAVIPVDGGYLIK